MLKRKRFINTTKNGVHISDYRKKRGPVSLRFIAASLLVIAIIISKIT